jgi:hypothetical protein
VVRDNELKDVFHQARMQQMILHGLKHSRVR